MKLEKERTEKYTFTLTEKELKDKYPMGDPQLAQVDCRVEECEFHIDANCINVAPAITLNPNGTYVCWSKRVREKQLEGEKKQA